jgi:hypothetical protein
VGRQTSPARVAQQVSRQPMAELRWAAPQRTGAKGRAVQAERTERYGAGNARYAERRCGWGRETLAVGLAERRTDVTCRGAQSACRGGKRGEDHPPQAAAALRARAAAQAQQDPTVRPPRAYPRGTAQAAGAARRAQGFAPEQVPAPSPMAPVRNRLGDRLRKVRNANPHQKLAQPDARFAHRKKRRARQSRWHRQTLAPRWESDGGQRPFFAGRPPAGGGQGR